MGITIAKVVCGLGGCLLAAILLIGMMLDRPPAFAFEQAVNHYYRNGTGAPRQLAAWLIGAGLARDWAQPATTPAERAPFPLLLSAASSRRTHPYQTYDRTGRPRGLSPGAFSPPASSRTLRVASADSLLTAIDHAVAGDIITIEPGTYDIRAISIPVKRPGSEDHPIYLRAETYGTVLLKLDTLEGFHVTAPFWVFENLRLRGICADDSACEHAFHVVGKGKSFTLRNSELVDFNAPVKVNPGPEKDRDYYADDGLLEYNSIYNLSARKTANPVTLVNINAADGWVVRGNYIADFAKNGGDHVSYAAFMKGNGNGGVFERNLIICEHRLPADEGVRVGLSFGGGGSGADFCKQRDCEVEFSDGIMRNNIVMNCSHDVGIYLNRAARSRVDHNLLYNNLGITVRFETSSASITNNIISGGIRTRDGGQLTEAGNIIARRCLGAARSQCELSRFYQAPDRADFRLKNLDNPLWQPVSQPPVVTEDFCGRALSGDINAGPIQYLSGSGCLSGPGADGAGDG